MHSSEDSVQETPFAKTVRAAVRSIPRGKVMSYGEVAKAAGSPRAARAVGTIMRQNYDNSVPCHRVICADGSPGEYNRGGTRKKIALLRAEGIEI